MEINTEFEEWKDEYGVWNVDVVCGMWNVKRREVEKGNMTN